MTGVLLAIAALAAPAPAPDPDPGLQQELGACLQRYLRLEPASEKCLLSLRDRGHAAGLREVEATACNSLSWLYLWFGRLAEGLREAERAAPLYRDLPDDRLSRWAAAAHGWLLRLTGQPGRSLVVLDAAVARSVAAGDGLLEGLSRGLRARTLDWMGLVEEAEREALAGVAAAERTWQEDHGVTLATALWSRGVVYDDLERRTEAIADYQRAVSITSALGFWQLGSILLENLAEDHLAVGELGQAEQELDRAEAAWRGHGGPMIYQLGFIAGGRGRVRLQLGRPREALGLFEEQLRLVGQSDWAARDALTNRARALRALHDPAARDAYWQVLRFLEQRRQGAGPEQQRAAFLAANLRPFRELISVLWAEGGEAAAAEAFGVAEAARSRSLLDATLGAGVAAPAAQPLLAEEVARRLGPGVALLEYVEADGELFVLALGGGAVRQARLASGAAAAGIADRAHFYRSLVEQAKDPSELRAAGARLHAELIAPALRLLPGEPRELVLSPDGALHELPFEALVEPDGGFLAERYVLRYSPSGSLLERPPREPGADPGLALGDPPPPAGVSLAPGEVRGDLRPLPRSRDEALQASRALGGRALVGAEASEAGFKRSSPERFRVLHFATHAFVDPVLPLRSALLLAEGDGEDGLLEAAEIYRLPLRADLVILSACSTGTGRLAGSDGVQSLARAFLHSGAGAVLATRWPVGDADSGALLGRFYAHAATLDAAAALRAAQLEQIRAGAPPRSWAGFTLTGAAVRLQVRPERAPWLLPALGALLLCAAAVAALDRRRRLAARPARL